MPIHIRTEPGAVAPLVFLPGDPARAEALAARLRDPVCYNRHRGLLGFTGEAAGVRLSVQTTGMGAPSAAIVAEELVRLGARVLVRVGTCGGVAGVAPGELVIATASCPLDGTTARYVAGDPYAPVASFAVTRALVDAAHALDLSPRVGLIATEDVFYNPDPRHRDTWAARGVLAFEMEASALFTVAALRGVHAGCLLTVSNTSGASNWLEGEGLQTAVERLLDVALAAAPALAALAEGEPQPR